MPDENSQGLLDRFLVGNTEFEKLNARLSAFNLFQVLRIEKAEIRHSNVLAWLLDPSESHGLGALFLKRFVASILMQCDVPNVTLTPSDLELMPFSEVEVYRERHNIDVLVRCVGQHRGREVGWCLLIENKIGAKESAGQLAKYSTAVASDFVGDQIIPIFLTLDGDDPSSDGDAAGFVAVSHGHVLEVALSVIEQHKARIPVDAQVFLSHYLNSLRRLTMQDPEIIELCKQIYTKHREALQLIMEYGASSELFERCSAEITKLVDCDFPPCISRRRVWFVPKEMAAAMPPVEMAGWKFLPKQIPACFWLRYSRTKLRAGLTLEIGPMVDKALRRRVLEEAEHNGLPVKASQYETSKFARLITESMPLQEDPETGEAEQSEEYVRKVCQQLWSKVWPKAKGIVPALSTALRTA